ncbi:hypothetical protein PO878_03900 [Iamia majanohamensis]|uniref:Uncharacterized protein n=1 Tax=Iamia majanohamensis TaxID=467976 RepID=A0AAF0BS78_9ACTN|nr:hypothetical protein [Iamia majanohamensis]WCO67866.1 hypothetical protein PO878_03900 [Iamia majanohamensis]
MTDLVYDGALGAIAALDGDDAVIVVVGPGYTPDPSHATVADLLDEVGRADCTVSTSLTSNVLRLDIDSEPIEVDIDSAAIVGGWVLATDGATDADRVLLRWGEDAGGTPADPYPISCPSGAITAAGS